MPLLLHHLTKVLNDLLLFTQSGSGVRLRRYQQEAALAIFDSIRHQRGLSFVVMFPRQSGKNEVQAHIEAYLLLIFSRLEGNEIVKIAPTWKPQSQNGMRRLERVLRKQKFLKQRWSKEAGYIYRAWKCSITFLSGGSKANIVGATASTLLEVDEAQDVSIDKYDKEIAPMAASTNATRVFWGTAWTSKTLLARELRAARLARDQDGIQRVFVHDGMEVGEEVPAYKRHVEEQVARLGRQHPMVKTQYFSEEIDAEGGMFPPARQALMWGEHLPRHAPRRGQLYAITLDVAGEDEGASLDPLRLENPQRDSTVLTVFEVELENSMKLPIYRVVQRYAWQGTKHTALFQQIRALVDLWKPRHIVVDATGVGSGLATYLEGLYGSSVLRFEFSLASKSKLGWDFLAVIETGRYKEPAWPDFAPQKVELLRQLDACQYEIIEGPNRSMRWGVPAGTRDSRSGEVLHDDLISSAALVAVLDRQVWGEARSLVAAAYDPLQDLRF